MLDAIEKLIFEAAEAMKADPESAYCIMVRIEEMIRKAELENEFYLSDLRHHIEGAMMEYSDDPMGDAEIEYITLCLADAAEAVKDAKEWAREGVCRR